MHDYIYISLINACYILTSLTTWLRVNYRCTVYGLGFSPDSSIFTELRLSVPTWRDGCSDSNGIMEDWTLELFDVWTNNWGKVCFLISNLCYLLVSKHFLPKTHLISCTPQKRCKQLILILFTTFRSLPKPLLTAEVLWVQWGFLKVPYLQVCSWKFCQERLGKIMLVLPMFQMGGGKIANKRCWRLEMDFLAYFPIWCRPNLMKIMWDIGLGCYQVLLSVTGPFSPSGYSEFLKKSDLQPWCRPQWGFHLLQPNQSRAPSRSLYVGGL